MNKIRWMIKVMIICCLVGVPAAVFAEDNTENWLLSDAYYDNENGYFVLTEDNKTWQTGSIWYNHPYYEDFTLSMDYYTGTSASALKGADGIAVAFYADYEYTMKGGEEMGFNGSNGYGIELDTYYNSIRKDPKYNHIALIKDSVGNHLITAPLTESEDKMWHNLRIVVEDSVCSAYVDGALKFSYKVEPTDNGWIGITSATGDGTNLHAVKNIVVSGDDDYGLPSADKSYLDMKFSAVKTADKYFTDKDTGESVGRYEYEITAEIENTADAAAKNVTATLDLPNELVLSESSSLSRNLGDIDSGGKKEVKWTVYADWPDKNIAALYGVTVNVNNAASLRQEDYIYLQSKKTNYGFIEPGKDHWKFSNSPDFFTDGEMESLYDAQGNLVYNKDGTVKMVYKEKYYLTDSDYNALTAKLSNLEIYIIKEKKKVPWGGSCYGMSVVAALVKMGVIKPGDIVKGSQSLYSINMSNNDDVESMINFYQLQQFTYKALGSDADFILKKNREQLEIIESLAEQSVSQGKPFVIGFGGKDWGHTVVGYYGEHGSWWVGDKNYDSRIWIYDPNYPSAKDYYTYLYYNKGTDEWVFSNYSDAIKLTSACNDISVLDYVNYGTATRNYNARLVFKFKSSVKYKLLLNGETHQIDGLTDERENGIITYFDSNLMSDGKYGGSMTLTLPDMTEDYSVIPEDGDCDFTMYYENSGISAKCEGADQIDFYADGGVAASGASKDYNLSLIFNDGYSPLPWYKVSVSGSGSDNISLKKVEGGALIEGDNLQDVTVTTEDDNNAITLNLSTDKKSALISSREKGDGDTPVILLDMDKDGDYETTYGSYTVTFNANGGTVDTSVFNTGSDGTLYNLATPVRKGYNFDGWYTDAAAGEKISTDTVFTEDTTVYAHWTEQSSNSGGGVSAGTGNGAGAGTDSDADSDITANEDSVQKVFTDVPEDAYYYDAVMWAVKNGITTGITETAFGPNIVCTRAQVVTFLWRCAGSPKAGSSVENPFADISENAYYYDAVLWAVEKGITEGTSDSAFSPDAIVNRAQVMTFLHRYEGTPASNANLSFTDVPQGVYYEEAVRWGVNNGVAKGKDSASFSPDDGCTRAEVVTFMYRALAD